MILSPIFPNIPDELKQYSQWVNWQLVTRKEEGKPTKPPYKPNGQLAKTNNSLTWSTFPMVESAAPQHDGIGFVLTKNDPFIGLDFDNCRCPAFDSDPEISGGLNLVLPHVAEYVRKLNSYTEVSPSGKGIRIILKGTLPLEGNHKGPIEAYHSDRYVTMTGHIVDGFPRTIEPRQVEVDAFYNTVFAANEKPSESERSARTDAPPLINWKPLLVKALQSQNGQEIKKTIRRRLYLVFITERS